PILGVCLGHQAICLAYGGTVSYARKLMHGQASKVQIDNSCSIFRGLPREMVVGRYHSLAIVEEDMPEELIPAARSEDGDIMAIKHREFPVFGLQFHPESILTPDGRKILENFVCREMIS
ncbi:MAG: gamma-glutamyl-gamma-aminobutyrate hydrolase family protein, partial [Candidatus Methanomethylophilaceae archaeon]